MNAIHPWLKGGCVGTATLLLLASLHFDDSLLVALIASAASSIKFAKDQELFEEKLLHRRRLYDMDVEQVFVNIQKALANIWVGESHWQNRTADLPNGYLLYCYEWREPESPFDDGRIRHHANLEIQCEDRSDDDGEKTFVVFNFDGLPNEFNKRQFYDAIHTAMGAIDRQLPAHSVFSPEAPAKSPCASRIIDFEMEGHACSDCLGKRTK